jgi:hypothetical protein
MLARVSTRTGPVECEAPTAVEFWVLAQFQTAPVAGETNQNKTNFGYEKKHFWQRIQN